MIDSIEIFAAIAVGIWFSSCVAIPPDGILPFKLGLSQVEQQL